MSAPGPIDWHAGTPELCTSIESALAKPHDGVAPLQDDPTRSVIWLEIAPASAQAPARAVVVKRYRPRGGLRGLRDALKRTAGRDAAAREWDALAETQRLGLPVPSPRARGTQADGTPIVAMEAIAGRRLDHALDATEGEARLAILARLADAVHAFHRRGLCHGDLHAGNVLVAEDRLVVLDLQRLSPLDDEAQRLADWARLCFSLDRGAQWARASAALRELAELGPEFDRAMQRFLADHQRGRRRRFHRVGRGWRRVRLGLGRAGIVVDQDDVPRGGDVSTREGRAALDASTLAPLLDAGPNAEARRGGRVRIWETALGNQPVVCKRVDAGGLGRAIANVFRGSDAWRAFRVGRADALVSDRAARPIACLERRVLGVPVSSTLVMERVGEFDLDAFQPRSPSEARRLWHTLAETIAEQHARGLGHRDLKAGNLRVAFDGDTPRLQLVDLGDLTGPAPLEESARIRALVQLNAAIADELSEPALRREALELYAERLPFETPFDRVVTQILQESRTRGHRWTGETCGTR